ncbi:MAG: hypothetical protein RUMPE_00437 [Eubacteriales bacterium SKADARSKE-1]|nr:hypothetical protein [Eubacteriales bacterium SKADARSKE-1]
MINTIKTLDERILLKIAKLQRPYLNKIMVATTTAGNTGTIWLLIAFPMLLNSTARNQGIKLILSLLLTGFMGEIIIKRLVGRMRPSKISEQEKLLIKKPITYSFPSGHTSSSFAAALTISLNYPNFAVAAFTLAGAIAFSRLYLRVHYPSDILAGAVLGIICSLGVNAFYLS